MDKFESKVMTSWWQYAVRPYIIILIAIPVSVVLFYNIEWHMENDYSYANWKATTVLKSSPKVAHYKDASTLETSSTIGS